MATTEQALRARVETQNQPATANESPAARAAVSTARAAEAAASSAAARAPRVAPPALRLREGAPPTREATTAKASDLAKTAGGGGAPLAPSVRGALEKSLRADLKAVRVHKDARVSKTVDALGARAVTYGTRIFLGTHGSPTDLALLAHEAAHVVQQGGAQPVAQKSAWGGGAADACEGEAQRAASAVVRGEVFTVRERASRPRVQRLGLSDALDRFAGYANAIPGYRMFTVVLGVNPINMSAVERSAANILRAVVEFIPGGNLITRALDSYGVFERVGGWIEGQIRSLGMTGAAIRDAIMDFLHSLSWTDIFDIGGVWERAKRIFTEPITRIINFARGLITGILGFVREAVLRPLAALAQNSPGYDLLKAVLGQDPVTGEAVPRNADTLIGGFMKLIGQQEVWNNLKRANAVARAWAWFQGALAGLMGFVRQIPGMIVGLIRSVGIEDFLPITNLFGKVVRTFGGFLSSFVSWAGGTVLDLLKIIFDVVAPSVMPYIMRAAGAFRTIIRNPVGFVGNLVRAGLQGFRQFAANFLSHLRRSLVEWITGTLSGAGVYIPQAFSLMEIVKFVLSVLGLTWQNIRGKLVRVIGETAVRVLEAGFDIVVTLVTQGPAAAWQKIVEGLSNLRDMVLEQIMSFVRDRVVQAAITRLLTSLNPAGAFIQAVIAIYNTVMFFVERLQQIGRVVAAYIDSIAAIASGNIGSAANRVETTMAGMLTLVISFLARIAGLGRVSDAVVNIINRVRAPIDRALDRVIDWIVNMARRVGRFFAQAGLPQDPAERLRLGLDAAATAVNALAAPVVTAPLIIPVLGAIKVRYGFKTLQPVERDGDWWVEGEINPQNGKKTQKRSSPQGRAAAAAIIGQNIDSATLPTEYGVVTYDGKKDIRRSGRGYSAPELSCDRTGVIKNGLDIRRADYFLIDEYSAEITKITADLAAAGRGVEGNPLSLVSDLRQRVMSRRDSMANGIRAQMKRIRDFLRGPDRLDFVGAEVQLGKKRSADYTLRVNDAGVIKNIAVEVKNWSTVKDADDLTDKGERLNDHLSSYVRLAKTRGNNYDIIRLEWIGFSRLDGKSQSKFRGIIGTYKGQATRKGITLEFNPM
ncbi:MAG: DUF4157 domain-containing protein [Acidobacteria bacterium]|nr:DUF4157 domain-containing protein [Acidobacteriota bacterium]